MLAFLDGTCDIYNSDTSGRNCNKESDAQGMHCDVLFVDFDFVQANLFTQITCMNCIHSPMQLNSFNYLYRSFQLHLNSQVHMYLTRLGEREIGVHVCVCVHAGITHLSP